MDAKFVPGATSMRRLTEAQYWNSIDDVFGAGAPRGTLDPDMLINGFNEIYAGAVSTGNHGVELYETSAITISNWAFADTARKGALVGCQPATAMDATCAQAFITRFGRQAFRRPLTDAEVARYLTLFKTGTDFWAGLQQTVSAFLQSPKFIYRVELGSPVAGSTSLRVMRSYDMAARLSFLLWGGPPDATLLDAAQKDQLTAPADVSAQAMRMLTSPRAHRGLRDYFTESLVLDDMDVLSNPQLASDLREEALQMMEDIVFTRNADYHELFTSTSSFLNKNLAAYYGVPAPAGTGFVRTPLMNVGPRVGFFGMGAFLVASSTPTRSSPTNRGRSVREAFLCQDVPDPPPGIAPFPMPSGTPQTTRQMLEQHRSDPSCNTCHKFMDGIGVAFENFDWQGKYRDKENGITIDPTGDLDGQKFADAKGLALLVAARSEVGTCAVRRFYRASIGHMEDTGDEVVIKDIDKKFSGAGSKVNSLIAALVASDGFRLVSSSQ